VKIVCSDRNTGNEFFRSFRRLFSDMSEIWCKRSGNNSVDFWWISWKWA